MVKKTKSIPVNVMANEFGEGIAVEKISITDLRTVDQAIFEGAARQSHRHDGHSFFLLENGTVDIEIDFQKYKINSPSVIYIHPNQVHQTTPSENVTVSSLAITAENLNPEYLKLLEDITPAKPLLLDTETFSIISEAFALCLKFAQRKTAVLYHSILKDNGNALAALVASQYLEQLVSPAKISRFEMVTKAFRKILEREFAITKRPAEYARKMNISAPYLNECVKNKTGFSVSYHIRERIVLEAKRLLYHSDKSVKEIAAELGYDDYPYFSRLFTKATKMTALTFRNKNRV